MAIMPSYWRSSPLGKTGQQMLVAALEGTTDMLDSNHVDAAAALDHVVELSSAKRWKLTQVCGSVCCISSIWTIRLRSRRDLICSAATVNGRNSLSPCSCMIWKRRLAATMTSSDP